MIGTQKLKQEIKQAAQEYLLEQQVVSLPVSGYEDYLKSGDRLTFEQAYFSRRRQLAVMALAVYCEECSAETLQLLEQIIWEICNEYTWALPAHLSIENGAFDETATTCIDLFAAETGQTLSEIISLVGSQLSPFVIQRVQTEIEKRIVHPFEAQKWAWEEKENNWSAVIAGCIGMTALSMMPLESVRLQKIVKRLNVSMESYLRGFGEDGVCVEGVDYWGYGFGYFIYYAERLAVLLNDEYYLKLPKVKAIATFPAFMSINEQDYVSFSDYAKPELPSGLLSFCSECFDVATPRVQEANGLEFDHCYRFAPLLRNLQWTKEITSAEQERSVTHYFPDAQWLVVREEESRFFFAAKGGTNEESHNHIDVGHFIFGDQKTLFLTDLGAGEYTRDYFSEEKRYSYFPTAAASHHLPIINGKEQQPGAVGAKHVRLNQHQERMVLEMTLQDTYSENEELTNFERSFEIDRYQKTVRLSDRFSFETEKNRVIENFVTAETPLVRGTQVILESEEQQCLLELGTTDIQVLKKEYNDHDGKEQLVYQIQAGYTLEREGEISITLSLNE
ncbi:heparinase II/III domain-containing protein [Candidatus Enterococcus clewellii]|uniref:Heparinase II/III-like C-terminal domain-containing protein n=1 Tax=Candidatus Enterococcus clewellii TaxID=1834193 RepID=A0A242KDZ9_9ENTE|nr:heparinase II/III family protein [Enterococcus sp. 9E7_DIV0242]OTP18770.1 hypothetical protein A5888_000584 [Enterococcus sp. 9E7_DIV0242]